MFFFLMRFNTVAKCLAGGLRFESWWMVFSGSLHIYIHYCSKGLWDFMFLKEVFLLTKDAFIWSKTTVKTVIFRALQTLSERFSMCTNQVPLKASKSKPYWCIQSGPWPHCFHKSQRNRTTTGHTNELRLSMVLSMVRLCVHLSISLWFVKAMRSRLNLKVLVQQLEAELSFIICIRFVCLVLYIISIVYDYYDITVFFSTGYVHFQNFASFFQNFTHKSKSCAQNAKYLTSLVNEALHSKYHKHISKANICKHLCHNINSC